MNLDAKISELREKSNEEYEMDPVCHSNGIHFHLKAIPVNRDKNGIPLPNFPRPQD